MFQRIADPILKLFHFKSLRVFYTSQFFLETERKSAKIREKREILEKRGCSSKSCEVKIYLYILHVIPKIK